MARLGINRLHLDEDTGMHDFSDFDSDGETIESLSILPRSVQTPLSFGSVRPSLKRRSPHLPLDSSYPSSPELPYSNYAAQVTMGSTAGISPTPSEDEASTSGGEDETTTTQISAFESLPTELLLQVAFYIPEDKDLGSLIQASPIFARSMNPDSADIWRKRFIARYDYPLIQSVKEYAAAYQIRRFILRKFDYTSLATGNKVKSLHQLLVVKEMLLEAYNRPASHLPYTRHSRNLAIMTSPDTSPWIIELMKCPLYAHEKVKYGQQHTLFDSIQILLSHLVLKPRSRILIQLPSSRDQYDLAIVYHFNRPAVMLLSRLPDKPHMLLRSSRFSNMTKAEQKQTLRYGIDLFSVLHIRNFWQRHFCDGVQGVGENTYSSMMQRLVSMDKMPRHWDRSILEPCPLNTQWLGHYSCLHPWPKDRLDLEERQSCAEDWRHVDPMQLAFETRTKDEDGTFWPPLFNTIPILSEALPQDQHARELNLTYLRGIAPFLDLCAGKAEHVNVTSDQPESHVQTLPKWHPFLSSRVHGFVHDITNETLSNNKFRKAPFSKTSDCQEDVPIPGWKRIVMIIYKPSSRQLVSVLEHVEEDFGGPGDSFNTADIWQADQSTEPTSNSSQESTEQEGGSPNSSDVNSISDDQASNDSDATEAQIEARMQKMLAKRIKTYTKSYEQRLSLQASTTKEQPAAHLNQILSKSKHKTKLLPPLFSPAHIRELEEAFSSAQYMTWDDSSIDYAYAYEGIIIPGGKIMLGRYWRIHGIDGMGAYKEIGPDGVGVELRPSQQAEGEGGGGEEEEEEEANEEADSSSDDSSDADSEDYIAPKKKHATRAQKNQPRKRKASAANANTVDAASSKRKKSLRSKSHTSRPATAKTKSASKSKSKLKSTGPHKLTSSSSSTTSDADNQTHNDNNKNEDDAISEYESLNPSSDTEPIPSSCPRSARLRQKKAPSYEFVTMVNGEESRAVNGCKGLERGPFVFWSV